MKLLSKDTIYASVTIAFNFSFTRVLSNSCFIRFCFLMASE